VRRLSVALALLALCGCSSAPAPHPVKTAAPAAGLAILQGATDATSTVISILVPKEKKYGYTILFDSTVLKTPPLQEDIRGDSPFKVVNIELNGLTPKAPYEIKVTSETGEVLDDRYFHTLPADLKSPRIAVISCMDDKYMDIQKSQWDAVWAQKPDMLFFLGDNVYVDSHVKGPVTDREIWQRYVETRQHLELYQMKELIPVFATWDDHDFGIGDGNSSFPYKEASKEIFRTFFPMTEGPTLKHGPGVSAVLTIAKQNFVFFDDRTFRTPDRAVSAAPSHDTHLGSAQEAWFFALLKKGKGPFWLMDGDQFFGGYQPYESFEGNHPGDFKNFLKQLKAAKKTVLFVSGDRHLVQIQKVEKNILGYQTYELTSSGIHAGMHPGSLAKDPSPRQVYGRDGINNFLILKTAAPTPRSLKLDATFFGEQAQMLDHRALQVTR